MNQRSIPDDLLAQLQRDRANIEAELPEMAQHDALLKEAADETTLSGHLRRAIHHSRRPLREVATQAGISSTALCDFLAGERTLRSDVLDRLAQAVGATITVSGSS
jgi:hypothetical protein